MTVYGIDSLIFAAVDLFCPQQSKDQSLFLIRNDKRFTVVLTRYELSNERKWGKCFVLDAFNSELSFFYEVVLLNPEHDVILIHCPRRH